jgi:hypothetical protein
VKAMGTMKETYADRQCNGYPQNFQADQIIPYSIPPNANFDPNTLMVNGKIILTISNWKATQVGLY